VRQGVKYKPTGLKDIRTLSFSGFTFNFLYEALEQAGTIDAVYPSWFAFSRLGG
jgi:hypothetical protein